MKRATSTPPELRGFEFVRLLGSGGFSDVFLYEQQLPRRQVAVKVLLADDLTPAGRSAFVDEANVMARLSTHPYIVSIFHADVSDDGRPYFIMEYFGGPSLGESYKRQPLSVAEALRAGVRISSAIATAHASGILHRDIKPANVLTNEYGWPGVTDFGIASAVEDELPVLTTTRGSLEDSGSTTGQSVGLSVPWSPPEMFDEDPKPDVRSDVFSLAATIYTLLAGRTPFEVEGGSNQALDLMARIERGAITPMNRTDVPASLVAVLRKGMAVDRSQRFSSAVDFARALQRVELELSYAATPIEVPNLTVPEGPRETGGDPADETRARAVKTVIAQAPVAPAPAAPTHDAGETRLRSAPRVEAQRPVRESAPPESTVIRERPLEADPEPDAVPVAKRRGRGLLIGVLVGIGTVVAVVVAVVWGALSSPHLHQNPRRPRSMMAARLLPVGSRARSTVRSPSTTRGALSRSRGRIPIRRRAISSSGCGRTAPATMPAIPRPSRRLGSRASRAGRTSALTSRSCVPMAKSPQSPSRCASDERGPDRVLRRMVRRR